MAIDPLTLKLIFIAPRTFKSIGKMLGIIESIDSKIEALARSKLAAALRSLDQAKNASSEPSKTTLLEDARRFFNEALSLEKNERLLIAHLGLAFSHFALGDKQNGLNVLKETEGIGYRESTKAIAAICAYKVLFPGSMMYGMPPTSIELLLHSGTLRFYQLKETIGKLSESLSTDSTTHLDLRKSHR